MFDMKILCAFYIICLMFTLEGARLTPAPWQQQHLSRKLNRESPLEPAGEHHHQLAADDLYSRRRQSPARCLRRLDKLPDHVKHAVEQDNHPPPSLRKLSSVGWRPKREARTPAARFHLHHPVRDRRKVIMPRRSGFGRRGHRPRRRRRKRKRKRSQPGEIVVSRSNTSVPVVPHEVVTPGPAPITAAAPNVAQAHVNSSKESDTSSGHIIIAVVSCLLALLVSGVLLFYLYSKSRRKSGFDPFYCPPEIDDTHHEDYNPSDIERCTCCSSDRRGAPSSSAGRHQESNKKQRATRPVKKVQPKKTATAKKKKSSSTMARKQPPAKQPPPFSETELREIQSRIACILRRDCARCNCCRCNAVHDEEQPRRSNKFKLFGVKKNKPATACNDARCDENKIRCLVNLCRASDTAGLRIKQ